MSQSPPPKSSRPLLQQLQQVWRKTQPVLKTQSVRTLRLTIRLLEGAAQKLEAMPFPDAIDRPPTAPATPPPIPSSPTPGFITRIRPAWKKFEAVWNPVLSKIRSLLPAAGREKLSNPILTSAIVSLIVMTVWTTSAIRSATHTVAVAPPTLTAPAKPTPIPEVPTPILHGDEVTVEAPAPSPIAEVPDSIETPTAAFDVELTAPEAEQPTEMPPSIAGAPVPEPIPEQLPEPIPEPVSVKPQPAPLRELPPEQRLIAAIENQVSEISSEFADGLIDSIQANFRSSRLTVKVGNNWYELPRSRQDQLAAEMLKRSRELEFNKLEITDTSGTLLARSPVVGSEMVILQRTSDAVEAG